MTIQGKGFGFDETAITVTATEVYYIDEYGLTEIADQTIQVSYPCTNLALGYRDAKVVCDISPLNLLPEALRVTLTVSTNGLSDSYVILNTNIQ